MTDMMRRDQAFSLSTFSLSHWSQAVTDARFDPKVNVVDIFEAVADSQGQYGLFDCDNCPLCQRLVIPLIAQLEDVEDIDDAETEPQSEPGLEPQDGNLSSEEPEIVYTDFQFEEPQPEEYWFHDERSCVSRSRAG